MHILFVSTGTGIIHLHNGLVYDNPCAFLDADRAHEARTAASSFNHSLISHPELNRPLNQVDNLYIIYLMVTTDKCQHQLISIRLESHCLDALFQRQVQALCHQLNSVGVRSCHFFQRLCFFLQCPDDIQLRLFIAGCIVTAVAVSYVGLTGCCQHGELMGMAAADGAVISLYRAEIQPHTGIDTGIGIIHLLIRAIHAFLVLVKGIQILHDELTATHQTKAGADLITILILNLIQHQRQLLVGTHFITHQGSHHFLMGRPQAELTAMTVTHPEHLITVHAPAAAFLPDFRRLHNRHGNLLAACLVHFLTDNLLNLLDSTPCQRQIGIKAAGSLPDHAGPQHKLMAPDLRFSRSLP